MIPRTVFSTFPVGSVPWLHALLPTCAKTNNTVTYKLVPNQADIFPFHFPTHVHAATHHPPIGHRSLANNCCFLLSHKTRSYRTGCGIHAVCARLHCWTHQRTWFDLRAHSPGPTVARFLHNGTAGSFPLRSLGEGHGIAERRPDLGVQTRRAP